MIVMKFGGTSIQNAERIKRVFDIVKKHLDHQPVIVASAFRGVTDDLIRLAHDALKGDESLLDKFKNVHYTVIDDLGLDRNIIRDNLAELSVLIKGISLVKELTPRTLDYVASFGERLSTRILAAHFNKAGIPSEQYDAFDIGMITDDRFNSANPLPEADGELRRHISRMSKLPIITGYIGKTRSGDITTLGRNGSDYTATIIGAAIAAREVQIWSDTDGIMTADPRVVPTAKTLEALSFEEASELAYYGGKVLHPYTLLPAIRKNIPVRALNTFKPEHKGTYIVAHLDNPKKGPKSIAHRKNQMILNITSPQMLLGYGFLSRIFDTFARHEVVINMVSTSEVSVSVTTENPRNLDKAVADLQREFEVTIERDKAIICVVGDGIKFMPGVAGDIFEAVREVGVNVWMISQGASKINIAFVVNNEDVEPVCRALHRKFFGE